MNAPAPLNHHPEGPSSWPMWSRCACFEGTGKSIEDAEAALLSAEEGAPDTGAEAKALGTLQHAALASIYTNDAEARAVVFSLLTDKQAGDVRWVATKINEIVEGLGYQPHELRVERRVTLYKGESFDILYFGTADIQAGPTIVIDAKFGLVRDYFAQLAGYLLPMLVESGHRLGHAFTVYGRARKVQSYAIDFATAEAVAYGILAKHQDPNRRPTPCEYCGWCKHVAGCSAINAMPSAIVERREDWTLKLPQLHASKMSNDPVAVGAALYIWKAFIEPWSSGIEFVARGMAERGMTPVGFNKQNSAGSVTIADGFKAIALLREAGVPQEALAKVVKVSMTGLVKAYMEAHKVGETAAKNKILALFAGQGVTAQGEAGFKLVRHKDGESLIRAALQIRASDVLTDGASAPLSADAPEGERV